MAAPAVQLLCDQRFRRSLFRKPKEGFSEESGAAKVSSRTPDLEPQRSRHLLNLAREVAFR